MLRTKLSKLPTVRWPTDEPSYLFTEKSLIEITLTSIMTKYVITD